MKPVTPSRRAALRYGSLVLLLQRPRLAFGAEIVAVRVWPAADYTRVTIESDAALTAKHSLVGAPDRLVSDVDGLEQLTVSGSPSTGGARDGRRGASSRA